MSAPRLGLAALPRGQRKVEPLIVAAAGLRYVLGWPGGRCVCAEGKGDAAGAGGGLRAGREPGRFPSPEPAAPRAGGGDGREKGVRAAAGKMAAAQARRPLKMVASARASGGKGKGAVGPASLGDVGGSSTLTSQGTERGRGASCAPAAWPCCRSRGEDRESR